MNRRPLADLNEELIAELEALSSGFRGGVWELDGMHIWLDDEDDYSVAVYDEGASHSPEEFAAMVVLRNNVKLVIECMRVALRWRNEMDQMKEERG